MKMNMLQMNMKKLWHNARKLYFQMYHVFGLKRTRSIKNVTLKAAKKFMGVAAYWEEQ